MPFEFRIDESDRIAYVRAWDVTNDASRAALTEALRGHERFEWICGILLDVRAVSSVPPPGSGRSLAGQWLHLAGARPVAIVARGGAQYGLARQLSILSDGQIQPFETVDAARAWLFDVIRGFDHRDGFPEA